MTGGALFRWRGPVSATVLGGVLGAAVLLPRLGVAATVPAVGLTLGRALVAGAVALRILVVATALPGTSGRERGPFSTAALNQAGAYSIVRHPLYLANLVAWLGVGLLSGSWWIAAAVVAIGLALYLPIARAEDHYLASRFGQTHRTWVDRTSAFLPRPDRWRRPVIWNPWREVVRREYASVAVVAMAVYLVESARALGRSRSPPALGVAVALLVGLVALKVAARAVARSRPRRALRMSETTLPPASPHGRAPSRS